MYHPRLYGTHAEIGFRSGEILAGTGFQIADLPNISVGAQWNETQAIVRDFYPEILEEMRAFAEACQGSYQRFADFIFGMGLSQDAPKCTCFAVTSGGNTYFARNHDNFVNLKPFCQSSLVAPSGFRAFIGHSDTLIGFEDGVNEHGLAAGITFVGGREHRPGMNFVLAVRCILEKCTTVAEAVSLLSAMPFSTYQNFILADRSGQKVILEASPHKVQIREAEAGEAFVAATNNFRHSEMLPFEQVEDRNWYQSLTRYETVASALQAESAGLGQQACQEILGGRRGFVCQFNRAGGFDTLWSVVVDLNHLEIYFAEGNPGRVKFQAETRLAWWLKRQGKER